VDVAIVGVGLHRFGRFGDRTGIDMGAIAIRSALANAGVTWRDIQFAFAGSYEIDNPDAVVELGHGPGRSSITRMPVPSAISEFGLAWDLTPETCRSGPRTGPPSAGATRAWCPGAIWGSSCQTTWRVRS
jgi:acetyl-CoA C-acetyltransferase